MLAPRAGEHESHLGPRAGEHEGHLGPRAGEHEGHLGPRTGEHEGHLGPRTGEHEGHLGPRAGGFHQSLRPPSKPTQRDIDLRGAATPRESIATSQTWGTGYRIQSTGYRVGVPPTRPRREGRRTQACTPPTRLRLRLRLRRRRLHLRRRRHRRRQSLRACPPSSLPRNACVCLPCAVGATTD